MKIRRVSSEASVTAESIKKAIVPVNISFYLSFLNGCTGTDEKRAKNDHGVDRFAEVRFGDKAHRKLLL